MVSKDKIFHSNDMEAIWQRFCGFLDLSVDEFMEIQESLLLDQIDLVSNSDLGKEIMGSTKPISLDDFRNNVPLTTYKDYEPFIGDCQEDALFDKPFYWAHTAGSSGSFKWVPYYLRNDEVLSKGTIAAFILAATKRKGEINIRPGGKGFINFPPRPYISGWAAYHTIKRISAHVFPPIEQAEKMEFKERTQTGLKLALNLQLDAVCCMSSILVKVGETMSDETQKMNILPFLFRPLVLARFLRARIQANRENRPVLPRDLWHLKGIVAYGVDTSAYKDKIEYYWGQTPYEIYVSTEVGVMAIQAWNKKAMTLVPDSAFYEFIPEEEWFKSREDEKYKPATLLLNQIEADKRYGLVISNFYGMPLLRYIMGDLIKVVSLDDKDTGIKLPQIAFNCRGDDMISIAGFPWLNEKFVWHVLVNTGIKYTDWTLRKEWEKGTPVLHLYIELKEKQTAQEVKTLVEHHLKKGDSNFTDLENLLEIRPLKATLLSEGTFQRYYDEKVKAGYDLARLKPKHMNVSDDVIQELMRLSTE
ncbi:MAG: GH3 auxin-responsive promoter family protein [Deltaproteobacteria bacterium]|nr:GH3 auxin-responsive promoter family protein [Deltaproteobacteria bacterium]